MSIQRLPNELLNHVFGFLDLDSLNSARQVCKWWKAISEIQYEERCIPEGIKGTANRDWKYTYYVGNGYFTRRTFRIYQPRKLQAAFIQGISAIQIKDKYLFRGDTSGKIEKWDLPSLTQMEQIRRRAYIPITSIGCLGTNFYATNLADALIKYEEGFQDFSYRLARGGFIAGWNQTAIYYYRRTPERNYLDKISCNPDSIQSYDIPHMTAFHFCEEKWYGGDAWGKIHLFQGVDDLTEENSIQAHRGKVYALTRHGHALYSSGEDEKLCVWNCETFDCLRQINTHGPAKAIQVFEQKIFTIENTYNAFYREKYIEHLGGTLTIRDFENPSDTLSMKVNHIHNYILRFFRDFIVYCANEIEFFKKDHF